MPDDTPRYAGGDDPTLEDTQPLPSAELPPPDDTPPPADPLAGDDGATPARVGCRTDLRGWAGAHLHGAVRPRRRAAGRGRPPGRWC